MTKGNLNIILGSIVILALIGGVAMAKSKGNAKGNSGFNDYGYNERAFVFNGCYANYLNWKSDKVAVECSESDLGIHAKWKFDKEGDLDWLINLIYSPVTGDSTLKRYVTISQESCGEIGGKWLSFHKVTQTGAVVPVCQITESVNGEEPTLIATPAGFGLYKDE